MGSIAKAERRTRIIRKVMRDACGSIIYRATPKRRSRIFRKVRRELHSYQLLEHMQQRWYSVSPHGVDADGFLDFLWGVAGKDEPRGGREVVYVGSGQAFKLLPVNSVRRVVARKRPAGCLEIGINAVWTPGRRRVIERHLRQLVSTAADDTPVIAALGKVSIFEVKTFIQRSELPRLANRLTSLFKPDDGANARYEFSCSAAIKTAAGKRLRVSVRGYPYPVGSDETHAATLEAAYKGRPLPADVIAKEVQGFMQRLLLHLRPIPARLTDSNVRRLTRRFKFPYRKINARPIKPRLRLGKSHRAILRRLARGSATIQQLVDHAGGRVDRALVELSNRGMVEQDECFYRTRPLARIS